MEELSFLQDPVPKNQFPSQYQNYNEFPAIFSSSLHQKVLCQAMLSLGITRRDISTHIPPVCRAVPVPKDFVAFPGFALFYFHHECLDLRSQAFVALQGGICP